MLVALVIPCEGKAFRHSLKYLSELQSLAEGDVEGYTFPHLMAFFNEDGIACDLPFNKVASEFFTKKCGREVTILGTVVILGYENDEEDYTDCPAKLFREFGIE